jgi:hypothetical protein
MTERYTHFNPMDFAEVTKVQASLLKRKPNKKAEGEDGRPALTLVKTPDDDKSAERRHAS